MIFYPYAFLEFQPTWYFYSDLLSRRASFQVTNDPEIKPDEYASYGLATGVGGAAEINLAILTLRASIELDLGPYRYDNYELSGGNATTYSAFFSIPVYLQAGLSFFDWRLILGPSFSFLVMLDSVDTPTWDKSFVGTSWGGGLDLKLYATKPIPFISRRSTRVGIYLRYMYFPSITGTLRMKDWVDERVYENLSLSRLNISGVYIANFSSSGDPLPFKIFSVGVFASF